MTPGAILVVDGKAESRAALVRVVKEAGYSVLEAGTGAEALALLSSLHPQLVLLDVDQLDANALDLARQVGTDVARDGLRQALMRPGPPGRSHPELTHFSGVMTHYL